MIRAVRDVTLYIAARDAARTLAAAAGSVARLSTQPAEFLIVADTRSRDGTLEIARSSGARVIEQQTGRLGTGRNLAIANCRTRWLASCDADVTLEPAWLDALLDAAEPGVDAVGGATYERLLTDADRWRAVNMPHNWGPLPLDNPFMLVSEMMADVEVLRGVGGYLPDLRYGEDSDLCQRLRHAGCTLRYTPHARALHDRADSVRSVLDLRWAYAYHRQRFRFESLPGLVEKLATNRSYVVQTLSATLHSDHPHVCAISLLLWFHHAARDLATVLERWTLLSAAERVACRRALQQTLLEAVDTGPGTPQERAALRAGVAKHLPVEFAKNGVTPADGALTGGPRFGPLLESAGFQAYLAEVARATRALLDELQDRALDAVTQSFEMLDRDSAAGDGVHTADTANAGSTRGAGGPHPLGMRPRPTPDDRRRIAAQPIEPAWDWTALQRDLEACGVGPASLHATPFGPVHAQEYAPDPAVASTQTSQPSLHGASQPSRADVRKSGDARLALVPHVETLATPAEDLRTVLRDARAAVVAYRTPGVFVPTVPLLSARDLACIAADCGLTIRHFHTEAGRTRLILERISDATPGGTAAMHRPAHGTQRTSTGAPSV